MLAIEAYRVKNNNNRRLQKPWFFFLIIIICQNQGPKLLNVIARSVGKVSELTHPVDAPGTNYTLKAIVWGTRKMLLNYHGLEMRSSISYYYS